MIKMDDRLGNDSESKWMDEQFALGSQRFHGGLINDLNIQQLIW